MEGVVERQARPRSAHAYPQLTPADEINRVEPIFFAGPMGNVTFALHQLGWADFQSLCHTITREILGQTVVPYLEGNDGGRDGAFSGTWTPADGENFQGEFVIQAKHTTKPDSTLGPAAFDDELDKAERLATAGICDVYVLMTNARITGRTAEKLGAELGRRGITQCLILGATWINQTITENSRLRMLVPRLYGLGDLTQILDERAYQQARAVLDSMRTDLAKLVRTTTYQRAADALDGCGFVLLTGRPGHRQDHSRRRTGSGCGRRLRHPRNHSGRCCPVPRPVESERRKAAVLA